MSTMNVICRRALTGITGGRGNEPITLAVACAEMTIEEENNLKYLTLYWTFDTPEIIQMEVTDEPVAEILTYAAPTDDDMRLLENIRSRGEFYLIKAVEDYSGKYLPVVKELAKYLVERMVDQWMLYAEQFECAEDVWPWLVEVAGVDYEGLPKYDELPEEDEEEEDEFWEEDEEEE